MQYIILIIICAFLFIGGPIILIGYTTTMAPLYLQLIMVLWIVSLMLSFIFMKGFKTPLSISTFSTTIFSIVFTSWYVSDILRGEFDDGGLGDAIGMFIVPFASAVTFGCIATMIRAKMESKAETLRLKFINSLKTEIVNIENEIKQLETKLSDKQKIVNLLNLMEACQADVNSIENNPEVSNIKQIINEIESRKQKIKELTVQIQNSGKGS